MAIDNRGGASYTVYIKKMEEIDLANEGEPPEHSASIVKYRVSNQKRFNIYSRKPSLMLAF